MGLGFKVRAKALQFSHGLLYFCRKAPALHCGRASPTDMPKMLESDASFNLCYHGLFSIQMTAQHKEFTKSQVILCLEMKLKICYIFLSSSCCDFVTSWRPQRRQRRR